MLEKERGQSVYELLEVLGWKPMKPPFHMRSYDCFRKGNRRAFITNTWQEKLPVTYYYAVEALPGLDSFGQRQWKRGCIIAADGNMPHNLLTKYQEAA
jgi:hypothetical protein